MTLAAVANALRSYGINEENVNKIRYVRSTLHGFVDLELGGGFALPMSVEKSFDMLIDTLDASLIALHVS